MIRVGLAICAVAAAAAGAVWMTRERATQGPGGPAIEAQVAETVPKVEQAVGLKFKRPPKVEVRSKAQVREFLEKELADPRQQREMAGTEKALKLLGVIPDTLDLKRETENLLTEQIAGFYDPKTKVLYTIDGESPSELEQVIPHELVHALQDQYVNLDSIERVEGNDDQTLAAQSVFEGQAVYEQLVIATGGTDFVQKLPQVWDNIREGIRQSRASMPEFANAPMFVQEETIFPYLSGLQFVNRYEQHYPGKVPFTDLPVSTQQVLSERAYFGAPRIVPLAVTLPKPARGTVEYENTMGEFQTRLFLYYHLDDQNEATRGAALWGGDRYYVVDLPGGGAAMVWVTVFGSPVDAGVFADLMSQVAEKRFGAPVSLRHYKKGTRTVTITPLEVSGHPAVLYVDLPAAGVPLIDPAKITAR
jgi:hypothetical protein